MEKKSNKKKVIILIGLFSLFVILLSLSSLAYYTNIGKWLDEQKNPYFNGEGQKRLVEDFIVNGCGSETMLDTLTGLCWDRNLNRPGSKRGWEKSINYCNDLNHAGHSNWRLAQMVELQTLFDNIGGIGRTCSTLSSIGFTNCQNDLYWTPTTYNPSTSQAYLVNLGSATSSYSSKNLFAYVACVRRN